MMDTSSYGDFYTSQKLVNEFHMLQDSLPITMEDKDGHDDDNHEEAEEVTRAVALEVADANKTVEQKVLVRNIDILKRIFDTLGGKDRIAKIIKYVLDLLKLCVARSRKSITSWDPEVLQYYSKVLKQLNFRMALRHPVTIAKILTVAMLRNFESKATLVSTNLSLFRQILRFGGTPFRVAALWKKLLLTTQQLSSQKGDDISALATMNKIWLNEASLGDFIDLYYGIMDELMLMHKFKLWSHTGVHKWVAKHEALSWYYDILLGLKKNWCTLQNLKHAQLELEIQAQVKRRALEISSRLHGRGTSPIKRQLLQDLHVENSTDSELAERLASLQREKTVVYCDLVRLSFDFLADTTDVFNMKTPPGTYAILSLASGLTGFVKLWINAKQDLSSPAA